MAGAHAHQDVNKGYKRERYCKEAKVLGFVCTSFIDLFSMFHLWTCCQASRRWNKEMKANVKRYLANKLLCASHEACSSLNCLTLGSRMHHSFVFFVVVFLPVPPHVQILKL